MEHVVFDSDLFADSQFVIIHCLCWAAAFFRPTAVSTPTLYLARKLPVVFSLESCSFRHTSLYILTRDMTSDDAMRPSRDPPDIVIQSISNSTNEHHH